MSYSNAEPIIEPVGFLAFRKKIEKRKVFQVKQCKTRKM